MNISVNDVHKLFCLSHLLKHLPFILFTVVACNASVSRETTEAIPLYDVTVTLLAVTWTWYRTVLTVESWQGTTFVKKY